MLRLAAIGLRIHGHGGVAEVLSTGQAQLVAVAEEPGEAGAARRRAAGERYGVPVYDDWRRLLERERPDIVVVCPPHDEKAVVVAACLEQGLHVLVDKPLAIDWAGLQAVERALSVGRAQLQMMLTERFNPPFVALKRLVDSGQLGTVAACVAMRPHEFTVVQAEPWMWEPAREGGIFLDLAIHDIDLVRWLTGSEVTTVQAAHRQARFRRPGFQDVGQALLRLDGGATATVEADWLVPAGAPWDCRFFVVGTEGTAEVATLDRAGLWYWTTGKERQRVAAEARRSSTGADLVGRILGDGPGVLSAGDAVAATRVALAARDAAETGQTIGIEHVEGRQ